jgi:DNA-directed RNA polymerase specialized sigma24 family protein
MEGVTGVIEDVELAREFERHRARLRAIAHRVLGSQADADDAVQETWLRLSRIDILADRERLAALDLTAIA